MQKVFWSCNNQEALVPSSSAVRHKIFFPIENNSYLLLAQVVVEHPKQLQNTLLPPGVTQARVIHHQVWIYFAIVTPYEETPCCRIVFLDSVDSWHEACNPHIVMRMLQQMQVAWLVLPHLTSTSQWACNYVTVCFTVLSVTETTARQSNEHGFQTRLVEVQICLD